MKEKKITLGLLFLGLFSISSVVAQSTLDIDAKLSGDLVSSYVWRGFKQAGASVQPSLSVGAKGFTLGAWASTDLAGNGNKEVDFAASYAIGGLTVGVTDYWWDGEGAYHYFSYPDKETVNVGHQLEANLGYTLPESFPLTLSWNTFFLGRGNKKANGDNSFSTYIQASYPFSVKDVNMSIAAGFTPWESAVYGPDIDGFKFTCIQLGASKEVKINDKFAIPVYANIIANPAREDIHFVFGITIK